MSFSKYFAWKNLGPGIYDLNIILCYILSTVDFQKPESGEFSLAAAAKREPSMMKSLWTSPFSASFSTTDADLRIFSLSCWTLKLNYWNNLHYLQFTKQPLHMHKRSAAWKDSLFGLNKITWNFELPFFHLKFWTSFNCRI